MRWATFGVLAFVLLVGLIRLNESKRPWEAYAAAAVVAAALIGLVVLGSSA